MAHFFKLFCLTLALYSCSEKQTTNYYWVSFRGSEYERSDTVQITRVDELIRNDTTFIKYVTKRGEMNYSLIENKDSSFVSSTIKGSLLHPTDTITFMRLLKDSSIVLNNDSFRVKEFILDEFVTDGASIEYYEPTLGVYAVHSDTWPGIRILQTNDSVINKKIDALVRVTVPRFFIRGKFLNTL